MSILYLSAYVCSKFVLVLQLYTIVQIRLCVWQLYATSRLE